MRTREERPAARCVEAEGRGGEGRVTFRNVEHLVEVSSASHVQPGECQGVLVEVGQGQGRDEMQMQQHVTK